MPNNFTEDCPECGGHCYVSILNDEGEVEDVQCGKCSGTGVIIRI